MQLLYWNRRCYGSPPFTLLRCRSFTRKPYRLHCTTTTFDQNIRLLERLWRHKQFSSAWAVLMASVIVSPSLSSIVLVNLVFCLPLDHLPTTISVNKSFAMHLCPIMCPMNCSFCCPIWLTSPSYYPISSSTLLLDLFSIQLTLDNLLYARISNECILTISFYFIAQHSNAYVAMGNTSDLSSLIFILILIDLSFHILLNVTVACFAMAILLLTSFVSS